MNINNDKNKIQGTGKPQPRSLRQACHLPLLSNDVGRMRDEISLITTTRDDTEGEMRSTSNTFWNSSNFGRSCCPAWIEISRRTRKGIRIITGLILTLLVQKVNVERRKTDNMSFFGITY